MGIRTNAVAGAVLAGVVLVPNAVAADAGTSATRDASTKSQGKPRVTVATSLWTVRSTRQRMRIRTTYPRSTQPGSYLGRPADIEVLLADGTWKTVGSAPQQAAKGKRVSTATIRFRFPEPGRIRVRARAHSAAGTYRSRSSVVDVRRHEPAFDPTALRHTNNCQDPAIGNVRHIAYACGDSVGTPLVAYDHKSGERDVFARHSTDPVVADRADVAISQRAIGGGVRFRAMRTRLAAHEAYPLAHRRDGKRVRNSYSVSVSANGRRVVYQSAERGIAPDAPKGTNVYLKRAGERRSLFVGRGYDADISANGRYVAWTTNSGRVRWTNLRTNKTRTVHGATLSRRFSGPEVSGHGRYVSYSERTGRGRRIRIFDVREGRTTTVGKGVSPLISNDGDILAYRRGFDLYAWSRSTGRSTLVSVGFDGNGSDSISYDYEPELSGNGRWLIAEADSGRAAPDNGRDPYDGWNALVLFDLDSLRGN